MAPGLKNVSYPRTSNASSNASSQPSMCPDPTRQSHTCLPQLVTVEAVAGHIEFHSTDNQYSNNPHSVPPSEAPNEYKDDPEFARQDHEDASDYVADYAADYADAAEACEQVDNNAETVHVGATEDTTEEHSEDAEVADDKTAQVVALEDAVEAADNVDGDPEHALQEVPVQFEAENATQDDSEEDTHETDNASDFEPSSPEDLTSPPPELHVDLYYDSAAALALSVVHDIRLSVTHIPAIPIPAPCCTPVNQNPINQTPQGNPSGKRKTPPASASSLTRKTAIRKITRSNPASAPQHLPLTSTTPSRQLTAPGVSKYANPLVKMYKRTLLSPPSTAYKKRCLVSSAIRALCKRYNLDIDELQDGVRDKPSGLRLPRSTPTSEDEGDSTTEDKGDFTSKDGSTAEHHSAPGDAPSLNKAGEGNTGGEGEVARGHDAGINRGDETPTLRLPH
ncbi:hypothetical protein DFH27DRAFT_641524 [Peziza echinospora]|nr:hypothetical protein DFH27DRAFT_641524 [Peziza echinospora]